MLEGQITRKLLNHTPSKFKKRNLKKTVVGLNTLESFDLVKSKDKESYSKLMQALRSDKNYRKLCHIESILQRMETHHVIGLDVMLVWSQTVEGFEFWCRKAWGQGV